STSAITCSRCCGRATSLRPRYIAAVDERVFIEGPNREILQDVWLGQGRPEPRGPGTAVLGLEDDTIVEVQVPGPEIHEPCGALPDWCQLYPCGLRRRLPRVRTPLADDDPDALLDVQAVLAQTYEAGCYRDRLHYDAPCVPPLAPDDQAWADGLIREAMQAGA